MACVVCWASRVLDAAARHFARTFFQQIAMGAPPQTAFEQARRAVLITTRDWRGRRTAAPCYELIDPDEPQAPGESPPAANGGKAASGRMAVGVPILLLAEPEAAQVA